ncbi:MAG: response regulator transcription factor [Firmicutes bacterium]|nr:response regulator transcription factor [Bacillota bacterium]
MHIGNMLEEVLIKEQFQVSRAYSGTEALLLLANNKPDLILLDLMLPGLSGEELLPKIQDIPIIVLSAKTDIQNKVDVLLSGAADYMTKPFSTKELLARITVQLRSPRGKISNILSAGDLNLDTNSREVHVKNNLVHLTKTEYAILKLLMQNPKQIISKTVMLERISQDTPDCTDSSLKQHISNLRKKLRKACGNDYIESIWGIGFKLTEK